MTDIRLTRRNDKENEVVFGCCFCGHAIDADPSWESHKMVKLWVWEGEDEDRGQQYWAHRRCLEGAMIPNFAGELRWKDEDE